MIPIVELNFPNPIFTRSDLFDRDPELELIQGILRSTMRRPIVIMGERVMGKTSLLNVVVEWATQQKQVLVLRLPPANSWRKLAGEILDGMAFEVGTTLHRLGLRDAQGQLRLSTVTEFAHVADDLSAGASGRSFLLCLDELDSMLVNCPDDASANELLDFILHLVTNTDLKLVCTMTRTAPHILRSDASPFMSAARIVSLLPWTPEESHAFVTWLLGETATIDDDAHELMFATCGGHPYLTKALLQTLHERDPHRAPGALITVEDVLAAIPATVASREVDFTLNNIVKAHFSGEELQLLRLAAFGAGRISAAELRTMSLGAAHELQRRRYLRADHPDEYAQAFGLLGEWLRTEPVTDLPQRPAPAAPASVAPADSARGIEVLRIDDARKRVFLGDRELLLTPQEYRFLSCLARRLGSVVERHIVATEVWPDEILAGVREGRLDTLVYRLREKLGSNATSYVETRPGRGFHLNPEHVDHVPEMIG